MEWREIESAPKDGTALLVYLDNGEMVPSMTTAKWSDLHEHWHLIESGAYSESDECYPSPTHWMLLPEPPK